jgi:hypothetical protein
MNQTQSSYPIIVSGNHQFPNNYKILFLLFLGQTGISILFNWVRKIRYLIRTNITKLFMILSGVSIHYFYYSYVFLKMSIEDIIVNSFFWITFSSILVIDLCVHPE